MKKIIEHIEKLIREHDCVIVPGLGGFLSHFESCRIDTSRNLFFPPTKKIGFNVHLTHSDGLLAQSIMRNDGLSYEEAMKLIYLEIDFLFQALKSESIVVFGNLGTLSFNNANKIIFEPNDSFVLSAENYGLSTVNILPLKNGNKVKVPQISKKKLSSKFLWTSVAAVLLLLLMPVNLFDKKLENLNQASFFSIDLKAKNEQILQEKNQLIPDSVQNELTNINNNDSIVIENNNELLILPEKTTIVENNTELNKSEKIYHIIIASLPNYHLAEQYIEETNDSLSSNLSIVNKDSRCRISIKNFANKSEAEIYLNKLKAENPQFSSAWILDVLNN